jgi:hypothetical protein
MLNVAKRLARVSEDFYHKSSNNFLKHDFPFQIEKSMWNYVDDIEPAQLVPFIMNNAAQATNSVFKTDARQLAVNMLAYEIDYTYKEPFYIELVDNAQEFAKHNVLVHKDKKLIGHPDKRLLYYDSMWDICKLYFTEYDRITNPHDRLWTEYTTKDIYNVPEIKKSGEKKFFSMAYVHSLMHPRNRFRAALTEQLYEFADEGYLGTENSRIMPNNPSQNIIDRMNNKSAGFWYPAADEYYQNTYLSIYVETITNSMHEVRCVTEKTFEPLIKGNFILPFGYRGMIQDIKEYGFIMPNWINYHYDTIADDEMRFQYFLYEVDAALGKSKEHLHELYLSDKHILEHNRKIFYDRPYDGFYNKLKSRYDLLVNS